MKRNIILLALLLTFMTGCLKDNTNYDYKDINTYSGWSIQGVAGTYSLFPGESVTLTPVVRLSRDTLNPEVTSSWLLNGEEVSRENTYTFVAEKQGEHELVYVATDPQTGVAFPEGIMMRVSPYNHLGWLFLSRTSAGKSHLSMVVAKKQQVAYLDDDYTRYRDTMVYVDFSSNLAADVLGEEPIKFMEEYPYPGDIEPKEATEILVLQGSGPVELGESELTYTGSPLNEFVGEVPSAKIVDAAVSFGSKWLLTEDGILYFSIANVLSDLHSGRFSGEPAFNGKKFKSFVEVLKCSDYPVKFVPVIDESQTMHLIVDDASVKYGVEGDIIDPRNYVGTLVSVKADPLVPVDMSLFKNFDGTYVQHLYVPSDDFLLSLIERGGQYYWHRYSFDFPYNFNPTLHGDGIKISESTLGKLANELFADFKQAAFVRFEDDRYNENEWLLVASGNSLYAMLMDWNTKNELKYEKVMEFPSDVAFLEARTFAYSNYIHVGVLLKDGTFQVLEMRHGGKASGFETKELYDQNIKQLDPDIEEVVDVMHKYGKGGNRLYGGMD